jgi:glucan phosphoethanolaminetransferase (alkaline phosphatase superfamily)
MFPWFVPQKDGKERKNSRCHWIYGKLYYYFFVQTFNQKFQLPEFSMLEFIRLPFYMVFGAQVLFQYFSLPVCVRMCAILVAQKEHQIINLSGFNIFVMA